MHHELPARPPVGFVVDAPTTKTTSPRFGRVLSFQVKTQHPQSSRPIRTVDTHTHENRPAASPLGSATRLTSPIQARQNPPYRRAHLSVKPDAPRSRRQGHLGNDAGQSGTSPNLTSHPQRVRTPRRQRKKRRFLGLFPVASSAALATISGVRSAAIMYATFGASVKAVNPVPVAISSVRSVPFGSAKSKITFKVSPVACALLCA